MIRILTFSTLLFLLPTLLFSQKIGYQIKVKLDGFEGNEAYLGYYFGDKQYLKDTAYIAADGFFYFEGNEKLPGGMYLVIMPPDNQFLQVLVNDDNQWFSLETKLPDSAGTMKVKDSEDNRLFYEYLQYLNRRRPEADKLREEIKAAEADPKKKAKLEEKLDAIDKEVVNYQKELVTKYPSTLTAAVIKANIPSDVPTFEGTQKEKELKAFYWMRQHWFDNIDLKDPRMLRTPFEFQKIDHYVQKMTVQHPDSLKLAIDKVLEMVRPAEETFKFYLIHFLNEYAKSNIVGMDAVYVHIAEKYYATGQAPWTEEEQLEKIVDNANRLKPLLIGEIAPDIEMETQEGKKIRLHEFESPLTVLFFWDPDCSHCKKSMPDMVKFAKDYKNKGVAVFAICTKLATRDDEGNVTLKEVDYCWSAIKEREMDVFFNTVDPYHRSRYKTIYDIRSTPQIYVLDTDKTILSKRIGAEQLPEVVDHILKNEKFDSYKLSMQNANNESRPSSSATTKNKIEIKLKKLPDGTFEIPCKVNGFGPLNFVFDTGASDVSISLTEALFMLKNGYLNESDIKGTNRYSIANGEILEGTTIVLRSLEFGGLKLQNIEASVIHELKAPLLLGQSALSKLGKYQFDYQTGTIIVN